MQVRFARGADATIDLRRRSTRLLGWRRAAPAPHDEGAVGSECVRKEAHGGNTQLLAASSCLSRPLLTSRTVLHTMEKGA